MKHTGHRSPPCDITRAVITIKGHGDLSSIENQARVVAALLGLPQPTDFTRSGVQQSLATASD